MAGWGTPIANLRGPPPVTGSLAVNSSTWDIPVNCETTGPFKCKILLQLFGTDAASQLICRVNGSSSGMFPAGTFNDPVNGPIYCSSIASFAYPPNGVLTNKLTEVIVTGEFPRIADGAPRHIKFEWACLDLGEKCVPGQVDLFYQGSDEIASIGIGVVTTTDSLLQAGSKYALIQVP